MQILRLHCAVKYCESEQLPWELGQTGCCMGTQSSVGQLGEFGKLVSVWCALLRSQGVSWHERWARVGGMPLPWRVGPCCDRPTSALELCSIAGQAANGCSSHAQLAVMILWDLVVPPYFGPIEPAGQYMAWGTSLLPSGCSEYLLDCNVDT